METNNTQTDINIPADFNTKKEWSKPELLVIALSGTNAGISDASDGDNKSSRS